MSSEREIACFGERIFFKTNQWRQWCLLIVASFFRTLTHQNRETRRKFNRTCDRAFTSMKSAALDPASVPTERLHAIIQANGFMMEAYRGGLRIKAKQSLIRRVRNSVSKWVSSSLRRLFPRRLQQENNGGGSTETPSPRLYNEKDLVKRLLHIEMAGNGDNYEICTFRMGRHFRRAVELAERRHDSKLHLILINAMVTAGVCSRLDVPIHGRVFVCCTHRCS